MTQLELIEPTGGRVIELAVMHKRRAEGHRNTAERCDTWGLNGAVKGHYLRAAKADEEEADCLAMLADFERLGGIT